MNFILDVQRYSDPFDNTDNIHNYFMFNDDYTNKLFNHMANNDYKLVHLTIENLYASYSKLDLLAKLKYLKTVSISVHHPLLNRKEEF